MLLAPRAFYLLAVTPIWLALAMVNSLFLAVAVSWLVLLVALLMADRRLAVKPDAWSVNRLHESRFSLGAPNEVHIQLSLAAGRVGTAVWIRDTPPDLFTFVEQAQTLVPNAEIAPSDRSDRARLPASQTPLFEDHILSGAEIKRSYWLIPPRRGDFEFGDLYVRWESPLGLTRTQHRFPAISSVKVYPNLANIRKYDLLLRRNRTWEIGLRSARRRGLGSEFEQLRDYVPDDEYRRIDWKATARRGKPIAVDFETERSQNIIIMLDIGRMMQSRTAGLSKLDHAINAGLLLAYVATQKGDRVGLLTFADTVYEWNAPRTGRSQFQRLLSKLYAVQGISVEPDYTVAFSHLATHHRRRSLLILVTDLLESLSHIQLTAQLLQQVRRHLLLVVTLQDPAVHTLAHSSALDSQSVYRRTVAAHLLEGRTHALRRLQNLGILSLDVAAHKLNVALIDRYLDLKSRAAL